MKNKIFIAAVGALTAITGFTSSVRAQSTQGFTLSDESLDVENLTIRDDYKEFFGRNEREDTSLSLRNPNLNHDDGVFSDGDTGSYKSTNHLHLQFFLHSHAKMEHQYSTILTGQSYNTSYLNKILALQKLPTHSHSWIGTVESICHRV